MGFALCFAGRERTDCFVIEGGRILGRRSWTDRFSAFIYLKGKVTSIFPGRKDIHFTKKGIIKMCKQCGCHHNQGCDCEGSCGGCDCGNECCHDGGQFQRRYQTKEEQISSLETYLGELKMEVQAVEERLADLRK